MVQLEDLWGKHGPMLAVSEHQAHTLALRMCNHHAVNNNDIDARLTQITSTTSQKVQGAA